jgi:XTP/dITP diphosphohydrolase
VADRVLYFATGNPAKLGQLRWVAAHLGCAVEIRSAKAHFGDAVRYDEIGDSERDIARAGAIAVAARIGVPALAEDTGLHVTALGGRPGIRAGQYLKDHGRVGLLADLPSGDDRRAAIVAVAAYATPGGSCLTFEHRVEGQIIEEERWLPGLPDWIAPTDDNALGGGYNAIFVPDGETRTLAEIPPHEALCRGYREPNYTALLRALGCA